MVRRFDTLHEEVPTEQERQLSLAQLNNRRLLGATADIATASRQWLARVGKIVRERR